MQRTEFKPLRESAIDWSPEECKHSKATTPKSKRSAEALLSGGIRPRK